MASVNATWQGNIEVCISLGNSTVILRIWAMHLTRIWFPLWNCDCECSNVMCHYPRESDAKRSMNEHIVATIEVLEGAPPKVPPSYDPPVGTSLPYTVAKR